MSEIVTKELREALDNPQTRYMIVRAWRARKAREAAARRGKRSSAVKSATQNPQSAVSA